MDFEELKYRLQYFYEDYSKYILIAIVLLVTVFAFFLINKVEEKEDSAYDEDDSLGYIIQKDEKRVTSLNETFSILAESDMQSPNNSNKILHIDLYLKTPYMPEAEYKQKINDLIETYKFRYNDDKGKVFVSHITMNVYTRALDYYEGLTGEYTVLYRNDKLDSKLEKELRKREKNNEEIHIDVVHYENALEMTKKPDYSTYMTNSGFTPKSEISNPYSDMEYAFYLKLNKYLLLSRNNLGEAIKLYLEWEYGLIVKDVGRQTQKQFEAFLHREEVANKGRISNPFVQRYQGSYLEKMYVDNPSLVLYSLTNYTATNNLEAMRLLVKLFPNKFKDVYYNHLLNISDDEKEELKQTEEEIDELTTYLQEMLANEDITEQDIEKGTVEKEVNQNGIELE